MIRMFHVYKNYPNKIQALRDINIHIKKGEFVFLVGPTGAGKSTFVKLIYRGIVPTKGQVIVDGINIARLKPSYVPYLRRNIGIVFQDFKLLYNRTVYENISFGLKAIGATNFEIRQQVKKVLNLVGLEHKKKIKPHNMIFENVGFYFREALLSFRRSTLISMATILSITTILIIVGVFLLISINSNLFLKNIESQLEIVVYLEDDISKAELNNFKNNFTSIDGIKEVKFVSKEEAYQRLLKSLGEQKDILSAIETNPLPASFEIRAKDPKVIRQIANQIAKLKKVEEVEYGQGTVEKLLNFTYIFRRAGILILALLVFASILIISNIIKITVYARRNEIEIMSLTGATSWFIKWPFIIEGFLQGFISAILSIIILYKFYFFAIDKVHQVIPFLPLVVGNMDLLPIGISILLLGSLVGILGSMFSVGKYLDV